MVGTSFGILSDQNDNDDHSLELQQQRGGPNRDIYIGQSVTIS